MLRILNPFCDLQICLKVRTTASITRNREVRNFAATTNELDFWVHGRVKHVFSLSESEKLLQSLDKSSMEGGDRD